MVKIKPVLMGIWGGILVTLMDYTFSSLSGMKIILVFVIGFLVMFGLGHTIKYFEDKAAKLFDDNEEK